VLGGAGLVALVAAGALAVVLLWRPGPGMPDAAIRGAAGIDAHTGLSSASVLFGDTVTARLQVVLDRSRVDPGSIRVRTDFSPWRPAGRPAVVRRDGRRTTLLQTSYVIRCLDKSCISPTGEFTQQFPVARVTYTPAGKATTPRTLTVAWPRLDVVPRYAPPSAGQTPPARWRAELVALPEPTYRLPPWVLAVLLLGGAALLGGVAAWLVLGRKPAAVAAPAIAPGPVPARISPLELALALLEDGAAVNGGGDQRRALELVAEGLGVRGERMLARDAKTMAWSRPIPGLDETSQLARRAREAFGKEAGAASI